uniref:Uncharacterized protein n=1 Tax=Megaselia scalaris TaxID=36166 RepID=T1GPM7_MEGSC
MSVIFLHDVVKLRTLKFVIAQLRAFVQEARFIQSQLKDKPLERALRDAILMVTNSSQTRQNILKKKDPILKEVLDIAKERELVLSESNNMDKTKELHSKQTLFEI